MSNAGTKKLNILAPTRYPWTFNGPRQSAHHVTRRNFIPFNKISGKIEGFTVFNPLPFRAFDLIHAFNRIPVGTTPYIIGFESHLPRAFGLEQSAYFDLLCQSLASDRCRGIYGISDYARRHFLRQHQGTKWFDVLDQKLHVRYPNMEIPDTADRDGAGLQDKIKLVFVGSHFARKGGTAVLRLAKMAHDRGFPLHIDIISVLEIGPASWVDPLKDGYFKYDLELAGQLPNLTMHGGLPNARVLEILKQSHFSVLPTFSDTFGFSAIESMANYIPVIATRQGALPEFIVHGENGILLPLDTNEVGEWAHIGRGDRASDDYAAMFDSECDRLASVMLDELQALLGQPDRYAAMRQSAKAQAKRLFSSQDANAFWDGVYEGALHK